MKLHEFQAKELFSRYGIPTQRGIVKRHVDAFIGFQPFHARELAVGIGLREHHLTAFAGITANLYGLAVQEEAELAEINPLAVADGNLLAVGAQGILGDSAAFRHPARPPPEGETELEG